jgi:NAD(P)-dependent dehydrogenase (short-subunit alcohol dehydrogenase family)
MYIKVNKSNYASCFTEAMTKHMAVEWGPDRIRVMCVVLATYIFRGALNIKVKMLKKEIEV